jgi:hypothetical protein
MQSKLLSKTRRFKMTLHEAYLKAKADTVKYTHDVPIRLLNCSDYGDSWGFNFCPSNYDENDERTWYGGGGDITVNKQTGEIGVLSMPDDEDIFDKGKPISIEQFADYNVAV